MGLVRLSTAKIRVFGFLWVRTLKLPSKMAKNTIFDWNLMILFIFSMLLLDFGRFWQFTIKFFPMKRCNHVSNFMILGRCFWGKKLTTRDWLWSQLYSVVRHVPRASSGSFLVRTASQSQRGGSIINMKGTERDRSKASINKGVWIV